MDREEIIRQIRQKADIDTLVQQAIASPGLINILVEIIRTDKSSVKFGCEKILRLVSEKNPALVYPHFDFFVQLLSCDNSFLKWGAIITLANLVTADSEKKFDAIFDTYFALVRGPVMVTAANIIGSAWKIAKARPDLTSRIIDEILTVEKAEYEYRGEISAECKNIVSGDAVDTLMQLISQTDRKEEIIRFVKKQLKNTRPKVRRKAERFMKLYS